MKKFISATLSIIAAALTFIGLCFPFLTTTLGSGKLSKTTAVTGWDWLDKTSSVNGYGLTKIFTIIALVIAGLVAICAIIMLLQQLKIVKIKINFGYIVAGLLVIAAVCGIIAMVGGLTYINEFKALQTELSTIKIGMGIILPWIINLVVGGLTFVLSREK